MMMVTIPLMRNRSLLVLSVLTVRMIGTVVVVVVVVVAVVTWTFPFVVEFRGNCLFLI